MYKNNNNKINRRVLFFSLFTITIYNFFNIGRFNFLNNEHSYIKKFIQLIPKDLLKNEIFILRNIKSQKIINNLIDKDYENKNLIFIDGWVLSKVEATLILNKYKKNVI